MLKSHSNIIASVILACTAAGTIGWSQLSGTGVAMLVQSSLAFAAVPTQINHQGVVSVNGVRFNGTGVFRFAIVDTQGNNLWTNDGSHSGNANRPTNGVTLAVVSGIYSVRLGDSILTNMTAIPQTVFQIDTTKLRVWFDDGQGHGIQQLSPDQSIASAAYSLRAAGTVPIGAIIAWHKSFSNCPPLPDGFVECNGQLLQGCQCAFDNQVIPDLNNVPPGYNSLPNGGGRFLRGGTTSGFMQEGTRHYNGIFANGGLTTQQGCWMSEVDDVTTFTNCTFSYSPAAQTGPQSNAFNRSHPVNMSVVWIMRVK